MIKFGRARRWTAVAAGVGAVALCTALTACGGSSQAKVGDCVKPNGSNDVSVVECGSSEAKWKVLGRIERGTFVPGFSDLCDPYPGTTDVMSETSNRSSGYTLCLGSVG